MSTLEELMRKRNGPYNMALRVKVVAVGNVTNYGDENKQLKNFAIADETSCMKAVCFDPQKFNFINDGCGLVLRNIILKSSEIVITRQSKLFLTNPPEVNDSMYEEGRNLIFPPAPPCLDIKQAKTSPKKQRISVKGRVMNEGIVTAVTSNDKPVDIKTITIADNTDEVKVTLWREKSKCQIHPGDYITVSHVVVNDYNDEINLNTTQFSQIEVIEAPAEQKEITIIGYMEMENQYEVITENNDTYTVTKQMLDHSVNTEELPQTISLCLKGKTITAIN